MRGYALIVETFCRRRIIAAGHAALLLLYALCFLWPYPGMLVLGGILFACAGILLPLLLSIGIFGDDIASGRFRLLASRPISRSAFYGWRVTGLLLQGAAHILLGSAILLGLHVITGRGMTSEFGAWLVATCLSYVAWTAFSTSLSVVTKGDHNSVFLILGVLPVLYLYVLVTKFPEQTPGAAFIRIFIEYALPPDILLGSLGYYGASASEMIVRAVHVLVLAFAYAALGIAALARREFAPYKA